MRKFYLLEIHLILLLLLFYFNKSAKKKWQKFLHKKIR